MQSFRDQIIGIQRKNYRKNLKLIAESLGYNPSVSKYEKEYLRYLKGYEECSDKNQLIKDILNCDLIFHGDYHTLRQSQRSILRIIRETYTKREVMLCMEMFHISDQKHIDSFITKRISEKYFLRKINYGKKWPYNWNNWRPLLMLARENGIPVVGINSDQGEGGGSLSKRDQTAAQVIVKESIRSPGKLVYVVDGDYHVAPCHLPHRAEKIFKILGVSYKRLIIYQNAENLYWKLCREKLEQTDVLKINDESYCLMNTMPANKIQSYLNWLEYSEDAYVPVQGDWDDDSGPQGISIHNMVHTIASVLKLEMSENSFKKLEIFYSSNLMVMDIICSKTELKGQVRAVKEKIGKDEGFLIEYGTAQEPGYIIYLPNSNVNIAAEEASHFVNAVQRGRIRRKLNFVDQFYWNVMAECLGFFGSKLINEKRKSQTESSLRKLVGKYRKEEKKSIGKAEYHTARFILQHMYLERRTTDFRSFVKKFLPLFKSRKAVRRMLSTQLGYMLGNRLYYAVKKGIFPMEKVCGLYKTPLDGPRVAFEMYMQISKHIKKMRTVQQY